MSTPSRMLGADVDEGCFAIGAEALLPVARRFLEA